MAKKVYFSPSDQRRNAYAVGNTTEAIECRKIALACVKAAERCGLEAKTDTTTNGDYAMEHRVNESNSWGADLHVPIHTNAHNGEIQGTRMFCYDRTGDSYKACVAIMNALAPITPGESDSITVKHFYEVHAANAPTAYLEVAFHDNNEEAQWVIDHTEEIAEAIVKGVCDYFGVVYVAPNGTTPDPDKEEEIMYNKIEEVPEYAKPTIQKLIDKGALQGNKKGELMLTDTMVRIFVINDRMGLYE